MTYDTGGTLPTVLEEDKLIEKEPIPAETNTVRVISVDDIFER